MRINLNFPDDLVTVVDARAKALNISRTAWIAMAVSQRIQADDAMANAPQLVQSMQLALDAMLTKSQSAEKPEKV